MGQRIAGKRKKREKFEKMAGMIRLGGGRRRTGLLLGALFALVLVLFFVAVRISDVTVTGNERYTDEQMEDILFPDRMSRNPVVCYLRNRFQEHEKIPFVEDYKILFQGINKVEIIVYEKSIIGYVSYMSSYLYFDKDGIVVESANEKLSGIPWITGLKFGHIILYQKLPVENESVFQEILNLTQILASYDMKVDKIEYNSFGEATLHVGDIEVILGNNESLNGKIAELGDMMPKLKGRKGTLYLENYDETRTGAMYTFKPER